MDENHEKEERRLSDQELRETQSEPPSVPERRESVEEPNREMEERRLSDREMREIPSESASVPELRGSVEEGNREIEERRLSDQDLREFLSEPPSVPELRKVGKGASTIQRTHSAWSAIKTRDDWERAYQLAEEDYRSGEFLIQQLGAERYLEPSVVVVLQVLRDSLIEDLDLQSAAEFMILDMALIAYYNAIKGQRMLGDLATQTERELFRGESLAVNLRDKRGQIVDDFKVEAMLNRASDKILPMIDRANQMLIRNLKALQDFKRGNLIIRTEQINIAQQQVNQVVKGNKKKRRSRGEIQDPRGDSSPNP